MKMNSIFPNYEKFKADVIDKLQLLFPNAEWMDEKLSFMNFSTLFGLFDLYYGDRDIRYDTAATFINKITFEFADILPDIYAKQQVFITNQLNEYLTSASGRSIKYEGSTGALRDGHKGNKLASASTPTNLVIENGNIKLNGVNVPVNQATINDMTFSENENTSNEGKNTKFVDDLMRAINADYTLRLKEAMNMLSPHFKFIVTSSNSEIENDGLYNSNRFQNGYYVSEVPYLGEENKEQINFTNKQVLQNTNDILVLKTNISNIPNFSNLVEQTTQNTNRINDTNNKVDSLVDVVNLNKQDTNKNTSTINQIIDAFKKSTIINYCGIWQEGTIASLGQVYSYDKKLFLCIVEQTTTTPSDGDIWNLISSFNVDMTEYYNISQIDNLLNEYVKLNYLADNFYKKNEIDNKISNLETEILNNKNSVENNINSINEKIINSNSEIDTNKNNITTLQTLTNDNTSKITSLKTDLDNLDDKVVDVNNKFANYYTKTDLTNYSVVLKPEQLKLSDSTKIDNYSDTEIAMTAPLKITAITTNGGSEVFRTETRTDGFYINNKKTISTYEASNLDTSTKVIDLGNKRKLLIFRFNWPSGNGTDSWSSLPTDIQKVDNIAYIEQVDFNIYYDGAVYSCIDCYPKVGIYSNRLYITRTTESSSFWDGKQARFRIIISTN